jgi:hypothetical protein
MLSMKASDPYVTSANATNRAMRSSDLRQKNEHANRKRGCREDKLDRDLVSGEETDGEAHRPKLAHICRGESLRLTRASSTHRLEPREFDRDAGGDTNHRQHGYGRPGHACQ